MKVLKLRLTLICMSMLLYLFVAGEAVATTYYVSPNGNDSNSGSESAPFRTIQKSADVVSPGDTVIVKDGTYTDTNNDGMVVKLSRGGISANWVTFKSENKWGAILDGDNSADSCFRFYKSNASYVRVEYFDIRGCRNGFHSNANPGNHDVYIYSNKIHDIARWENYNQTGNSGVYVGAHGQHSFTFDSNIFYKIGRLNPYTTPSAPQSSCTAPADYVYKDKPFPNQNNCYNHDQGLYLNGANHIIMNNIFYDSQSGYYVVIATGADSATIVNNTMYGPNPGRTGNHILIKSASTGTHSLENNISYNANGCAFKTNDSSSNTIIVKNNIVYPDIPLICPDYEATTTFGNMLNQDPIFVYAGTYDFRIEKGSPAIDQGVYVSWRNYDADSNQIIGTPDIGAYEYTGQTPDPSPTCDLAQNFEKTTLSEGMEYYTDRTFTLTSLPSKYIGMSVIKTPNDEKDDAVSSGYMRFKPTDTDTVYVAYDCRGESNLPDWLSSFTDIGDTISTSLSTQPCLRVYKMDYSADSCIDFGANKASGTSSTSYSNYIVFYGQISDATLPSSPFNLRLAIN